MCQEESVGGDGTCSSGIVHNPCVRTNKLLQQVHILEKNSNLLNFKGILKADIGMDTGG